jgi:hypothetical protein
MIRALLDLFTTKGRARRRRAMAIRRDGYFAEFRIGTRVIDPWGKN